MFLWKQDEIIKAKDDIIASKDIALTKKDKNIKKEIIENKLSKEKHSKLKKEVCSNVNYIII